MSLVLNCQFTFLTLLLVIKWELITFVGVEHVGGDMFASVPSGDAIFIKVIFFFSFSSIFSFSELVKLFHLELVL